MLRSAMILTAACSLVLLSAGTASADGASDYTTYCSTCHGAGGAGDGAAAAGLDPKPADFTTAEFWEGKDDAYLTKVIKEGGTAVGKSPLMAAWGSVLSDEQIKAVVEHLNTMKK